MTILSVFNKPKNILELFSFDITKFFSDNDYEEVQSNDIDGIFMVEFEKQLPHVELSLFDKVVFRMFNNKKNITGSNHVNITFPANDRYITKSRMKSLVNTLFDIYGHDDEHRGEWSETDDQDYADKTLEREWILGEGKEIYTIKLSFTEKYGFLVKILFFNHLIEVLKKEEEE